ncbi:MAG: YkgJ family cysteine cluster protein [Bryobacteraceae bacterium]|nr:YkgJ family cysteine cluster protein [Bryobacteraceae bacterium]
MITDLVQIRRLGEQKREENARFRKHLKTYRHVERRLKKIAQEVEEGIDCLACGNCCRVATAKVLDRDVERLARHLRIPVSRVVRDFCQESEEEGWILKRSDAHGCVFLSGNECTVYQYRPGSCADFPHLARGARSLESRMWAMPDRATYCPIVYNTLEAWKQETGFSPSPK